MAGAVTLLSLLVVALLVVPENGILRDPEGELLVQQISPFLQSMVALMLIVFFLPGLAYGIVTGSIFAVAASGLVVTYTTSGIFNIAHGAIGMLMAFTYWELRINQDWPAPLAFVLVVLILAPLLGAVIERVLVRGLRNASIASYRQHLIRDALEGASARPADGGRVRAEHDGAGALGRQLLPERGRHLRLARERDRRVPE